MTTKNLKICDSPSDNYCQMELCLKELMHICRKELIRNLLLMCFHHRGGVFWQNVKDDCSAHFTLYSATKCNLEDLSEIEIVAKRTCKKSYLHLQFELFSKNLFFQTKSWSFKALYVILNPCKWETQVKIDMFNVLFAKFLNV